MAILLIEEVLVGLDDVKASLEQAMIVLDVLVDDLHPRLGEDLRAMLEQELLQPLRSRVAVLENLQATIEVTAA
jgi:hypothetical protein